MKKIKLPKLILRQERHRSKDGKRRGHRLWRWVKP